MKFWKRMYIPALTAIAAIVIGGITLFADIAGSAHDFSGTGWSGGEICLPCHTPHNADTTMDNAPLWNHRITTAAFTLYSSQFLVESPEQPRGVSKLCLSCHDGTVAVDSFGNRGGGHMISGSNLIGTNLQDDHPISIKWTHQNEYNSMCNDCHTFSDPPTRLPFYDSYVECATCHDVHNKTGLPKLLRITLQNSALCFICHGK